MASRIAKNKQAYEVGVVVMTCELVISHLPRCGLTEQELADQIMFWEGKLTVAQERLYNLRNGDVPCPPSTVE